MDGQLDCERTMHLEAMEDSGHPSCWGCGWDYTLIHPNNPELHLLQVDIDDKPERLCPACYDGAAQEGIIVLE